MGGRPRMVLEDLARFIASRRPEVALRVLHCFYLQEKGITKAERIQHAGLKLRRWWILRTEGHRGNPPHYHLALKAFHAQIDTLLCDPLKNLTAYRVWQSGPIKIRKAETAA